MIKLGNYYLNSAGQTGQLIPLPDANGIVQQYLTWGYGAQPSPGAGAWIMTPNLHAAPFNVPLNATAVRFHIKAKAKTITWTPEKSLADIQVAVRNPYDPGAIVNECVHATASQVGGSGLQGEQIAHTTVDVTLHASGKVEIFHYPSVIGYANLDLMVYLAGYWANDEAPVMLADVELLAMAAPADQVDQKKRDKKRSKKIVTMG